MLLLVVALIVALLYYATPNVQQPKFRWISVGAFVAILVWVIASVGFAFYVGQLLQLQQDLRGAGRCHRGAAVALDHQPGAAVRGRARLRARARPSAPGRHPAEEELQLPARDTRNIKKQEKQERKDIALGRKIRTKAERNGATHDSDQPHDSKEETR